jgi:hypothetical protein
MLLLGCSAPGIDAPTTNYVTRQLADLHHSLDSTLNSLSFTLPLHILDDTPEKHLLYDTPPPSLASAKYTRRPRIISRRLHPALSR